MKIGRPKFWADENIERAKGLMKSHTAREVGQMFNKSGNAVLGVLYRDKVNNGYVPPPDSKHSKPKPNRKKYTFRRDHNYGERKCNICEKVFIQYSKFLVFCDNCRKKIFDF